MEYFSTTQIAERCGVARQTVVNYTHLYKIKVVKRADSTNPTAYFYDKHEAEKLCQILANSTAIADVHNRSEKQTQKEKELEEKRQKRIEALKPLHPLVKDSRCFDENFWP